MKLSTCIPGAICHYFSAFDDQIGFLGSLGFKVFDLSMGLPDIVTAVKAIREGQKVDPAVKAVKDALKKHGLSFGQGHSALPNIFLEEDWSPFLEIMNAELTICKALDVPRIVVHCGMKTGNTKGEFFDKNRQWYRSCAALAEKYGMEILVENIGSASDIYYFLRDGRELRVMVDYIAHPLVFACWDSGHANHFKQFDQYESIEALGDKLKALHIQDNYSGIHMRDFGFWSDLHQTPFWGNTNWDSVMQGLLDIQYQGTFNFEADPVKTKYMHRRPFVQQGQEVTRLATVSKHITELAVALMYETGKYILESYGCFEG